MKYTSSFAEEQLELLLMYNNLYSDVIAEGKNQRRSL